MQKLDDSRVVLDFLTGAARPDDDRPGIDLMLADADGEALKVIIPVDDLPARPAVGERALITGNLVGAVAHFDVVAGLVLAVRRGGTPAPRGDDLAWHDAFDAACREHGVTNLGVYVATRRGAQRVEPLAPPPARLSGS
jgi:hypothetical protein